MFTTTGGIPQPRKNLEAFVDAGTVAKNVTFEQGAGEVVNGRNIVKAGSIVGGFLDEYNAYGEVLDASTPTGAQGVLLEDVDVTNRDYSGAVMIAGWINSDKLDYEVTDELKGALTKIGFIANGNHEGGQ